MIVCDEGHKIKTHNIAASKAMHRLAGKAKYRLLLTGTVITNKPIDVFSQYKFCDPAIYGNSFYQFRKRYFDMVGFGGYTPVMKLSMEGEFTERLHSIAFRATKAECLDLPEFTDIVQRIDLEPQAMRIYRQLVRDSYAELAEGSVTVTNVLSQLLRLSQLTGGYVGNDDAGGITQVSTAKLDALSDLVDGAVADGRKIVARGECPGEILFAPQGTGGFGYDPVFFLPELGKTYAELTPAEKNAISHRARALQAFCRIYQEELEHDDK